MFGKLSRLDWPMGDKWGELSRYYTELNMITRQYSLIVEKAVMSTAPAPYRCILMRWNRDPSSTHATKQEVLGVYQDLDEIIGVLKLLVANEKEKVNERRT